MIPMNHGKEIRRFRDKEGNLHIEHEHITLDSLKQKGLDKYYKSLAERLDDKFLNSDLAYFLFDSAILLLVGGAIIALWYFLRLR